MAQSFTLIELYEGSPSPSDTEELLEEASWRLSGQFFHHIDVSTRDYVALALNDERSVRGVLSANTTGHFMTIDHLLVAKGLRAQGLGSALLHAALQAEPMKEAACVSLVPSMESLGFYHALGFTGDIGWIHGHKPAVLAGLTQRQEADKLALLTCEC